MLENVQNNAQFYVHLRYFRSIYRTGQNIVDKLRIRLPRKRTNLRFYISEMLYTNVCKFRRLGTKFISYNIRGIQI